MLIEVKVKLTRTIDNRTRRSMEIFVMDCEFFANAELTVNRILNADSQENGGPVQEFEVQSIKQSSLKEIRSEFQGSRSFIATLVDLWTDDSGTDKKLRYKVLLWADDLSQATERGRQLQREGYDMLIEGVKEVNYTYVPNIDENTTI